MHHKFQRFTVGLSGLRGLILETLVKQKTKLVVVIVTINDFIAAIAADVAVVIIVVGEL